MEKIENGYVVMLKSGGPKMTVSYISKSEPVSDSSISCIWFDAHGVYHEQKFKQSLLIDAPGFINDAERHQQQTSSQSRFLR